MSLATLNTRCHAVTSQIQLRRNCHSTTMQLANNSGTTCIEHVRESLTEGRTNDEMHNIYELVGISVARNLSWGHS